MPPSMAAANPLSAEPDPYIIGNQSDGSDQHSRQSPIAAEREKDSVITQPVLMPTSCAANLLLAVAKTAFPVKVLVKKAHSPKNIKKAPR